MMVSSYSNSNLDDERKDIAEILACSYGSEFRYLKRLGGYEDLNCLIACEKTTTKYVLKIINHADSKKNGLTEAVIGIIQSLSTDKCLVPYVMLSKEGGPVVRINSVEGNRKAILLTYITGAEVDQLDLNAESFMKLCYEVGVFAGNLDARMQMTCELSTALEREYFGIKLENIRVVRNKLSVLTDENVRDICEAIIKEMDAFCSSEDYKKTTKGVIHGDLTLNNLIFDNSTEGIYSVNGIIDFLDASISAYVFEVASTLVSVMHEAMLLKDIDAFEAARTTMSGYRKSFSLNSTDLAILYYAVLGRLCVLRVFCGYDLLNSARTAEHFKLNFSVLENIMKRMWKLGQAKWNTEIAKNY